ncbi:MAG: CYTH and CHAD domain-containing protein [Parvibaculum sp.]|uniref:CYTH and CHAD domain-containing protein n=1 Tax=Parvibaculum sp. TaxID=2024848 RepID=UPI0034A07796
MSDREIELKLVCEPAELERVRHSPALSRLKRGRASGKHLHSTYFDTDNLALGDHGFALRLRRSGGTCLQTLKTETGLSGDRTGALARDTGEYEARLPRAAAGPDLNKLPASLRSRIQKLANGNSIAPRLVSDIRRTVHCLETPDGDVIELALDKGALRAGAAKEIAVSEIELELKEGSPESLYRLALDLNDIATLRVGFESKSERGFALLRPRAPMAVKAETLTLAPDATLEDAYATILRHCLVHLTSNEMATVEARLPEALHQMRVALRRARSALAIFRPAIGGAAADRLAGEAKWLANELGPARDFDVFVGDILAPVAPRDAALTRLAARADTARKEAWDRALAALVSRRYTRFLLEYGLFLAGRGWRVKRKAPRLARDFAIEALDRRLASVVKLGRDIETLDLEGRHELRKRLKKFRYALHFFSSLFDGEAAKPYIRHLSQLQDVFGGLNDVATAHLILDGPLAAASHDATAAAAARVVAWSEKRAAKDWKGALRLWRHFRQAELFWRG